MPWVLPPYRTSVSTTEPHVTSVLHRQHSGDVKVKAVACHGFFSPRIQCGPGPDRVEIQWSGRWRAATPPNRRGVAPPSAAHRRAHQPSMGCSVVLVPTKKATRRWLCNANQRRRLSPRLLPTLQISRHPAALRSRHVLPATPWAGGMRAWRNVRRATSTRLAMPPCRWR